LALDVRLPDGGFRCTVLVDRLTWLGRELIVHLPSGKRRIELQEYAAPQGFQVATEVRQTGMSGEVSTYSIETVAPMPMFVSNPYRPRTQRPADTRFLQEFPAELAKVRITASGHTLVRPRIARQDGGWFLLDSGAGMNCIDPAFADALGLEPFGVISVVGVGSSVRQASFRRGSQYELGPMVVQGIPWVELDLGFLESHFGVKVNGVLGHDTFARAGIEIDLDAGRVWVQDPDNWTRPSGGAPLVLDQNTPCVECSFAGGHRGWFRFDTGSDDTVTFHGPTVERLGLIEDRTDLKNVKMAGVGGVQRGKRGPLEWFELCGERFDRLPVTFLSLAPGALNDATALGNIGGGLVRGYRVSVDVPGGKLFLTPSK
ncbi:MAG: aspartyl protease family protein, partial [bacterium]